MATRKRSTRRPPRPAPAAVPRAGAAESFSLAALRLLGSALTGRAVAIPARVGKALLLSPESERMRREAGRYVRELRELAGLTRDELAEAVQLGDRSLLEAVEDGTATLSFELILRLSALLARNDPVPFVARLARDTNPALWKLLEDWGIGRIPLQLERERRFLNVFRGHDAARRLSDEGFEKVLELTRSAFEMALHFVAEQEGVEDRRPPARRRPSGRR
jgi:transcriptional regulator with XRE-family HTH domain